MILAKRCFFNIEEGRHDNVVDIILRSIEYERPQLRS